MWIASSTAQWNFKKMRKKLTALGFKKGFFWTLDDADDDDDDDDQNNSDNNDVRSNISYHK